MRIVSVTAHNYGPFYGEHTLSLVDRGLVLVLGDNRDEPRMNSNGSGKSSIFDALDWCLFGQVPRDDHVDSVVNDIAGQDCWVRTLLDDDGQALVVERSRKVSGKTSGLSLLVGGKDVSSLDMADTQKSLEKHLGVSRDVFHAAVLFGQFDLFSFAEATDSGRMDILTQILGLGAIDLWLARAKDLAKAAASRVAGVEDDVGRLAGELRGVLSVDLTEQIAAWEGERESSQAQYRRDIEEATAAVQSLREQALALPAMREGLSALQAQRPVRLDLSELEASRVAAEQTLQSTLANTRALEMRRGALAAQQKQIEAKGVGYCGECGQQITGQHIVAECARLQAEATQVQGHIDQLTVPTQQWRDHSTQVADQLEQVRVAYDQSLEEHRGQELVLTHQIAAVVSQQRQLDQAEQTMRRGQAMLASMSAQVNPFAVKHEDLQRQIAVLQDVLGAKQTEADALSEERAYLDFWVTGLGPKGLKNYILDTRLEEMTREANRWVHLLTGGTVWVRFETQTMGRSSKKLSNKINVRVFRYNTDGTTTERGFRSWSGGERHRVSLGIDFGLSRLIAVRAAKSYDILILDELFRHLDRLGREAVVEMLQELRRDKSSLFVVDHDAEFQEAFEQRVLVRKEHGTSIIMEVDDDGSVEAQ